MSTDDERTTTGHPRIAPYSAGQLSDPPVLAIEHPSRGTTARPEFPEFARGKLPQWALVRQRFDTTEIADAGEAVRAALAACHGGHRPGVAGLPRRRKPRHRPHRRGSPSGRRPGPGGGSERVHRPGDGQPRRRHRRRPAGGTRRLRHHARVDGLRDPLEHGYGRARRGPARASGLHRPASPSREPTRSSRSTV